MRALIESKSTSYGNTICIKTIRSNDNPESLHDDGPLGSWHLVHSLSSGLSIRAPSWDNREEAFP